MTDIGFFLNTTYVKYFLLLSSIIFSSAYIYIKALHIHCLLTEKVIFATASILLLLTAIYFIEYNYVLVKLLFIVFTCFILLLLKNTTFSKSLCTALTSICISNCFLISSVFIVSILFWIFGYREKNIILTICIVILQILTTFFFMKLKRFKNGFSFLNDKNNFGIGLLISGFIIIVVTVGGQDYIDMTTFTVLIIGAFISSLGLFLWIRKSITEHYRKKLQARADEQYQNTLAQKDKYIEQLTDSNAFLAKIVHRDNHLMSSLQYAIENYKSCNDNGQKEKLLDEILTLINERSELIQNEQLKAGALPSTGIAIIDGALCNMLVKAVAHSISLNLIVSADIHYLVNNIISQTNLATLLSDHIKDAIIAIDADKNTSGTILVTFTMVNSIYEISIKDNGVEFDIDTLCKLGLENVTTHSDSGGSGIGFMTTFETLRSAGATLIITEYKEKLPFSKSITFRFDGQNTFAINSFPELLSPLMI